jgi:hypothetical protein
MQEQENEENQVDQVDPGENNKTYAARDKESPSLSNLPSATDAFAGYVASNTPLTTADSSHQDRAGEYQEPGEELSLMANTSPVSTIDEDNVSDFLFSNPETLLTDIDQHVTDTEKQEAQDLIDQFEKEMSICQAIEKNAIAIAEISSTSRSSCMMGKIDQADSRKIEYSAGEELEPGTFFAPSADGVAIINRLDVKDSDGDFYVMAEMSKTDSAVKTKLSFCATDGSILNLDTIYFYPQTKSMYVSSLDHREEDGETNDLSTFFGADLVLDGDSYNIDRSKNTWGWISRGIRIPDDARRLAWNSSIEMRDGWINAAHGFSDAVGNNYWARNISSVINYEGQLAHELAITAGTVRVAFELSSVPESTRINTTAYDVQTGFEFSTSAEPKYQVVDAVVTDSLGFLDPNYEANSFQYFTGPKTSGRLSKADCDATPVSTYKIDLTLKATREHVASCVSNIDPEDLRGICDGFMELEEDVLDRQDQVEELP